MDKTKKLFEDAKEATTNIEAITTLRPSDRLHTYSDCSQDACAIGGRMIDKRIEDGKDITKLVGYYSAQLDGAKVRWNPCEGESLGCRLVLEHFASYIRQSIHTTIHHCDNQPTTQARQRFKKGAYSTSSRISAFLTGLSTLSVEIEYTPGKDLHTSDYFSRHPVKCNEDRCQICVFNKEWTDIGDSCAAIRTVTMEEIMSGQASIPYHQRKTWKEMPELRSPYQSQKPDHLRRPPREEEDHLPKHEAQVPSKSLHEAGTKDGRRRDDSGESEEETR